MLAGREEPPLSLQRLRLAGQLTAIREEALACTAEESAAVLRASGLLLADRDAAALHELTRGWPAGLRLAALSLADLGAVPRFLERFLERDVALADYLASEVLAKLPDTRRRLVLHATVDDLVCGALVDAVMGTTDAAAQLADCERRRLFVTRVDGGHEEWFSWHQVFAGQMRRHLELEDPAGARRAHLAAAAWWRNRDPGRAVRHAVAGGDPGLATDVVAEAWVDLALRGESHTLRDLVALLPTGRDRPEQAAEPMLASCYAHLLEGDLDQATADLRAAVAAGSGLSGAARWRFAARAGWLRLLLVDRHLALRDAVAEAQAVLDEAPAEETRGTSATHALALLAVGMGQARLQEDFPTTLRMLRAARDAGRAAGLDVLEFVARAELCIPRISEGRVSEIEAEALDIVEEATRRGWETFGPLSWSVALLGWLAYWRGDMPGTIRESERAREICPAGDWSLRGFIAVYHGLASLRLGDVEAAESDLRQAWALVDEGCLPPFAGSLVTGLEAEILAARGDLQGALETAAASPEPVFRLTACTRADLARRTGSARESLTLLDNLVDVPLPQMRVLRSVLRALALHDLGEHDAAHAELEAALAAAEPAGLVGPFLAHADEIAPLLDRHLARGTTHESLAVEVAERVSAPVTQSTRARHARLTQRELTVLRYLRTTMPNVEIAAELYVSVNTVKTHAAAIYRKLGVANRRQAVRRAQELGLLGPSAANPRHPASPLRGDVTRPGSAPSGRRTPPR